MTATKTATAQDSQVGEEARQRDAGTDKVPDTRAEKIPDCITILADGLTLAGMVRLRGETITITPELVKQASDRDGNTVLTLDAEAQIRRFGRQMLEPGNHAAEVKAEDDARRAAEVQARARAEDPGMQGLRDVWAEEAAAEARSKLRWKSTNSGRSPHT